MNIIGSAYTHTPTSVLNALDLNQYRARSPRIATHHGARDQVDGRAVMIGSSGSHRRFNCTSNEQRREPRLAPEQMARAQNNGCSSSAADEAVFSLPSRKRIESTGPTLHLVASRGRSVL